MQMYITYLKELKEQFHVYPCIVQLVESLLHLYGSANLFSGSGVRTQFAESPYTKSIPSTSRLEIRLSLCNVTDSFYSIYYNIRRRKLSGSPEVH